MPSFNLVLAYVADVPKSVALYRKLLGAEPVEASPNFAMFVLPNGRQFGLWSSGEVEPAANKPGGIELAFAVDGAGTVDVLLSEWKSLGLSIIQQPTAMDFGLTFTATDPDGHRLRVYAPGVTAVHSRAALAGA